MTIRVAGLLVAVAALTACSDSGSGGGLLRRPVPGPGPGPGPSTPVANAGPDQSVARGAFVWLGGGGSYSRSGGTLSFAWAQTAGPSVTLSDPAAVSPTFIAPSTTSALRFTLRVTDGSGSSEDEVVVLVGDLAPVIWSLVITPERPITTDPLVASATVVDPDPGDSVTLTWEWRRNGVVLAGETGATLPASLTTRGDVLLVTLRASDGIQETSAQASVTIQDAPTSFTFSIPDVVTWGQPLTFTATASDPDGDPAVPGSCVLRRGPAGMTLSPSCEGSWTPTLPMFDRTLDVTFEVGLAGTSAGSTEHTVRVVDPARRYPLRRSGLDIPVQQNGLVAIDPDGDGTSTLLVAAAAGVYELARVAGTYQQVWSYPFAPGGGALASLEAGDVDGDGRPEIFFSSAISYYGGTSALVKLDGLDRREVARTALGCLDLELADVDRDGALDLVCLAGDSYYGSTQRVVILDPATLAITWQSAPLALGTSLAVGNVDGDPALEMVTAGGYVFDGVTHAIEWAYAGGFGWAVDTGDLDGDGVEEIVGMEAWSRFRGFSAVYQAPLWEQTTFDNDALLVADVDGDGTTEIVVGDGQWGNVTAYRYRPATNDLAIAYAVNSQEHGVTSLAVADLDGDGSLELAWGTGATSSGADRLVVAGRHPGLAVEWTSGDPSELDGPFLGAIAARTSPGAAPALLFQTARSNSGYDGARLVRLDPGGAVTVSATIGTNWSGDGALAAADFDGDGVDEAFMATASLYDGYFVAWDFAAGAAAWTSPANVGNGRAIVAADLNGDGAPDLVTVTSEGYVIAYDVLHSALIFKSTSIGSGVALAVADLDGTGEPRIVALSSSRLVLFHKAPGGPVAWLEGASITLSDPIDLVVGDCDGDGIPEIYVLSGWWYGGGTTVQRFDGALASTGSFAVRGNAQSLFVEDLGVPRKNLVLGKSDASYGATPTGLEAVDPVTGGRIWQSPPLWGTVPRSSLRYVDLDRDGFREIAFGTSSAMYLTR